MFRYIEAFWTWIPRGTSEINNNTICKTGLTWPTANNHWCAKLEYNTEGLLLVCVSTHAAYLWTNQSKDVSIVIQNSRNFFPPLEPIACFSALSTGSLGTGSMFSRPWNLLNAFLRSVPAKFFPDSRLVPVTNVFPRYRLAVGTRCMISRACRQLHVFPRLITSVAQKDKTHDKPRFYTCLSSKKTILLSTSWHCKRMKQTITNLKYKKKTQIRIEPYNKTQKYLCFSCFSVHFFDNVL